MLDLAVKFSTWGPAYWLHTKAEIGSSVALRVGGDFHYPNLATEAAGNLVANHSFLFKKGHWQPLISLDILLVCGLK